MLYPAPVLAVCVATAFIASGCGSGSPNKTVGGTELGTSADAAGSGKALSRTELLSAANAICKRLNTDLNAVNVHSRQQYGTALPHLAAQERAGFTELGQLTPPENLATDMQQLVKEGQTLAADTNKVAGYILSYNNRAGHTLVVSANTVLHTMRATAKKAGLAECARFA